MAGRPGPTRGPVGNGPKVLPEDFGRYERGLNAAPGIRPGSPVPQYSWRRGTRSGPAVGTIRTTREAHDISVPHARCDPVAPAALGAALVAAMCSSRVAGTPSTARTLAARPCIVGVTVTHSVSSNNRRDMIRYGSSRAPVCQDGGGTSRVPDESFFINRRKHHDC